MDTLKERVRITGAARTRAQSDVRKQYERGKSIREIAVLQGRSYGFVHGLLTECGVDLRSRGGSQRRKK